MKSARGRTLSHVALLALPLLVLGYWTWQRYHQPLPPTYEGKALEQWIADLDDSDCLEADRVAAVLIRIGAPAAPSLAAALKHKAKEKRIEVILVRMGAGAVPALIEELADETSGEEAAHVLGLIGPRAADAVPNLIAVLNRHQAPASLRSEAAFALGRIGELSAAIVPALSAALKDNKMEVREQAAEALGWIGSPAREAAPALVAALKDEELKVVRRACQALSSIGDAEAAPALLELFRSDRAEVAGAAGRALWGLGPKADSVVPALLTSAQGPIDKSDAARNLLASFGSRLVPVLVKTLSDDQAARREAAADVLGRIGPPARAAVPALLALLKDKSAAAALTAAMALSHIDSTRAAAAAPLLADALDLPGATVALANIGPSARAAVPALIAALKPGKNSANADLLYTGVRLALARIGPSAVPALIETLKDKRPGVAPMAAEALSWVLPPQKSAVPALRQAIKEDRAHADVYALALMRLSPLARDAVPELTDLLTDPSSRAEAAQALVRIDPGQAEKVVPLLIKDLRAPDEKLRQRAAAALGTIGPAAKAAVADIVKAIREGQLTEAALLALPPIGRAAIPSLVEMLKDTDVRLRQPALKALHDLGPAAREALPALIAALSDREGGVRIGAAHVLEALGPDAAEAAPVLIANLQSSQPQVRYSAALALGTIGAAAKEARRPLLECLLDPDEGVRYAAALSLGRIDPHFTEAAPALRDALNDGSSVVRLAAIDSLSHIDAAAAKDSVPILIALWSKPDIWDFRFRAIDGLCELAPDEAKRAVPWLSIELTDFSANALYAARLLARIDPSRIPDLVLALAATLRTPVSKDRRGILQTLTEFGRKAREAAPEIERLLYDGTPGVREDSIRALRAVNPARLKQLGLD
jgi:HEAT repeat protein